MVIYRDERFLFDDPFSRNRTTRYGLKRSRVERDQGGSEVPDDDDGNCQCAASEPLVQTEHSELISFDDVPYDYKPDDEENHVLLKWMWRSLTPIASPT